MQIDVKVDTKQVERALEALGRETRAAVNRSAKRTLTGTRQLAVDMTRAELNIKESAIKKRMALSFRAAVLGEGVLGSLFIAAKPTPLLDFAGTRWSRRRGVTFKPKRKGGRKQLSHAFIATFASGARRVVTRKIVGGKPVARLPLKVETSTFVSQFLGGTRQIGALVEYTRRRFSKELANEVRFRLQRRAGRQ